MASVRTSVRPSVPAASGEPVRRAPSPQAAVAFFFLLPPPPLGGDGRGGEECGALAAAATTTAPLPCLLPASLGSSLPCSKRFWCLEGGGAECVRSLPAWIDLLAHGGASLLQYGGGGGMTATASSFRLNSPPPIVAPPPNLAVLWPSQVLLCLLLTSMCVLMYPLSPAHLLH